MTKVTLETAAAMVAEHSWGSEYPVNPLEEISKSEYCIGAYAGEILVGFATVNRFASPDGVDNGELWLGHAVVVPEFREQGIYRELYDAQVAYAEKRSGRVLACTSNSLIEQFLSKRGWRKIRTTKDEAGEACDVFERIRE